MAMCEGISAVLPWMSDIRRAAPREIRSALSRVMHQLPPTNSPGLEDGLGRGGDLPSEGGSLVVTAAQTRKVGSRAEQVAVESIDRIRLSRAPHLKFKHLLGPGI